MTKTPYEAVDWMIEVVKTALEDGTASASELEEWLLAAISLEELALDEAADAREARNFPAWMKPAGTLH